MIRLLPFIGFSQLFPFEGGHFAAVGAKFLTVVFFTLVFSERAYSAIDVKKVGELIKKNEPSKVLSQDAAYSVDLGGSTLWLFGDTFFGTYGTDKKPKFQGAIHNSSGISVGKNLESGFKLDYRSQDENGKVSYYFRNSDAEDPKKLKLWPSAGLKIKKKFYLYYSHVEVFGTGSWDFIHVGQGLAVGKNPRNSPMRIKSGSSTVLWKKNEPRMGISIVEKNEWIYVYGRFEFKPHKFIVARVKGHNIEDPKKYRFFSSNAGKTKWVDNLEGASSLFNNGPPEATVSFNKYLDRFFSIFCLNISSFSNLTWLHFISPISLFKNIFAVFHLTMGLFF